MSAYELEKDVEVVREELKRGHYKIVVSLRSYNQGPLKLQLSRVNLGEEKETFVKLGRLSKEDVVELLPLIEKLIPQMDKPVAFQEKLK